jgi:hypothetical protein
MTVPANNNASQSTKERLKSAHEAVHRGSTHARTLYLVYLSVSVYLAITFFSTTHIQLLRRESIKLPLLEEAWEVFGQPISLQNRDLRYANFEYSVLVRADLNLPTSKALISPKRDCNSQTSKWPSSKARILEERISQAPILQRPT